MTIDEICQRVTDKDFSIRTLNDYSPAASATGKFQVAKAVFRLGASYGLKSTSSILQVMKEKPYLTKRFKECQDAYVNIVMTLKRSAYELKEDPQTANYDIMLCYDSTKRVKDLVGGNSDKASKTVMKMTLKMEKLIAIAVGATEVFGG